MVRLVSLSFLLVFTSLAHAAMPASAAAFIDKHCIECHDSDTKKG